MEKEKGGGIGEPPCVSPGKMTSTAALRAPSVHLVGRLLQGEETKELRANDEEKRPELSRARRRQVGCSLSVEEPPTESSRKGLKMDLPAIGQEEGGDPLVDNPKFLPPSPQQSFVSGRSAWAAELEMVDGEGRAEAINLGHRLDLVEKLGRFTVG
ncbi:unnamed protein product [Linum trigynum]|uniref:Uncharacterized protein n=1 Tax=Linum trigynum TaxID=586398 RepID=A0AAV2F6J0_9ROSI